MRAGGQARGEDVRGYNRESSRGSSSLKTKNVWRSHFVLCVLVGTTTCSCGGAFPTRRAAAPCSASRPSRRRGAIASDRGPTDSQTAASRAKGPVTCRHFAIYRKHPAAHPCTDVWLGTADSSLKTYAWTRPMGWSQSKHPSAWHVDRWSTPPPSRWKPTPREQ